MLRASRAFSLLLASERGARRHALQPAPVALAYAARHRHAAAGAGTGALLHRDADARTGAAGGRAGTPGQYPGRLPRSAAGRAYRAGRACEPAAAEHAGVGPQRYSLLLGL